MHSSTGLVALAALLSSAQATIYGFNYGAQFTDDSAKTKQDFANEFEAAQKLVGSPVDFTSARLYTMIQHGTTNDVISAIPAAIESKTRLLLGLWASGDPAGFKNELLALKSAIKENPGLADLVDGISVGSEDLYRISEIGLKAPDAAPGNGPNVIVNYIKQVRDAIKGTDLSDAKVGHVDTWTAWANSSNVPVAEAADWIGLDTYPYFQDTMDNPIEKAADLFDDAITETKKFTKDVPIWITETGWAVSGPTKNKAKADTSSAKKYWDAVGCDKLFGGDMNTWWYTLYDSAPKTPSPSFGILKGLNSKPVYDISCKNKSKDKDTTSSSESSTKTKGSSGSHDSHKTKTGSATASGTASGTAYSTGSAPLATGTSSAGPSNSSTNFVAQPTPAASGSTGGDAAGSASGAGASSSSIATGAAMAQSASLFTVFAGAAVGVLFL